MQGRESRVFLRASQQARVEKLCQPDRFSGRMIGRMIGRKHWEIGASRWCFKAGRFSSIAALFVIHFARTAHFSRLALEQNRLSHSAN
jgi:hypothetical protein